MVILYDIALKLSHDYFHILFFVFGIFAIDKNKFLQILSIAMLASLINFKLKEFFAIPLDYSLRSNWFAYPSGHTNFNVVIWGATFLVFRKWWILLIPAIIFPFSFMGMIHYKYHSAIDIAGGFAEALVILIFFHYSLKYFKKDYSKFIALSFISGGALIYLVPVQYHRAWVFMHLGSLAAIYFLYSEKAQKLKSTNVEKIFNIVISMTVFSSAQNLKNLDIQGHWILTLLSSTIISYMMVATTQSITHRLLSFLRRIRPTL